MDREAWEKARNRHLWVVRADSEAAIAPPCHRAPVGPSAEIEWKDHPNHYADPFHDVSIEVTFASPSGQSVRIGGFDYGSRQPPRIKLPPETGKGRPVYEFADQSLWKARLAPSELGSWKYEFTLTNTQGRRASGDANFAS